MRPNNGQESLYNSIGWMIDNILLQVSVIFISMSLHPMTDIIYEPPGDSYFHALLDKEFWILVFEDLLKIKTAFKCHITCFLNVLLEGFAAHP